LTYQKTQNAHKGYLKARGAQVSVISMNYTN